MPVVTIEMLEGRTEEQKRQMVKEVTEAIVKTANATPESVAIVIREFPGCNFAKAGVLVSDMNK
jgi:4-oxalocrotonate tautomerase